MEESLSERYGWRVDREGDEIVISCMDRGVLFTRRFRGRTQEDAEQWFLSELGPFYGG